MKLEDAQNIFDLRDIAKRRLPRWLFEFVDRGTEEEVALRNNREAFERIKLRPRMLVDVSGASSTRLSSAKSTRCRSASRLPAPRA